MKSAPLRVALVDDEELARRILREYLSAEPGIDIVAECANGFEAVKAVSETKPDVLLLDIQMPKLDGFEVLELIDEPVAVVFVTAYDEYALRAFQVHAVDYLLKPVTRERLVEAIARVREPRSVHGKTGSSGAESADLTGAAGTETRGGLGAPGTDAQDRTAAPGFGAKRPSAALKAGAEARTEVGSLIKAARPPGQSLYRILIKDGARVHVIPIETIACIEAQDDYVSIRTEGKVYLKQQTLSDLESALDPQRFVRIHRSYLLNIDRLARIEAYAKDSRVAILKDGTRLPMSRSGYARLKQLL